MTTVYEIRYSQNGNDAEFGPALATLWDRPAPPRIPSDCVVVAVDIGDDLAERICE